MFKSYFLFLIMIPSIHSISLWKWNQNVSTIYNKNLPTQRYVDTDIIPSACANGNKNNIYGFACPHMMMFAPDMLLAAKYDKLDKNFLYATAGSSNDNACGKCYQIKPMDAERVWNTSLSKKQLIVQVINSGFDVMPGQFDLFMGAGGFGYFTSCNKDCYTKYCQGGPCKQHFYSSTFDKWNHPHYSDPNACYSGGIKWLNEQPLNVTKKLCHQLSRDNNIYKDSTIYQSCVLSNQYLYHQNFVSLQYLPVQCPKGLTLLTGLKRNDENNLPVAHIQNPLPNKCTGSRENGRYCITTMQDCCKPSCSWTNKGSPDKVWKKVDTCSYEGRPF